MKRILSLALCFLLAFTLCQPVFAEGNTMTWAKAPDDDWSEAGLTLTESEGSEPGENVCEIIGGVGYSTLDQALAAVQDGETIRLLKDINYSSCIVVRDKSITFNLNGFDLNVVNETATGEFHEVSGLYVEGNAEVNLEGEGEFNVTGGWFGVYAEGSDDTQQTVSVTVTNATGILQDGVAAQCATVTVREDVTSHGSAGVWTAHNAIVIVEGDVQAYGDSIVGVRSDTDATVTVKGNVTVEGSDSVGIEAGEGGDVTVDGNVTVSGSNSIGVYLLPVAGRPSIVTLNGEIITSKFLVAETEDGLEDFDYWRLSFDPESDESCMSIEIYDSLICMPIFAGGKGTPEEPYLIANGLQLDNMRNFVYLGMERHYRQVADIDVGRYFSQGMGWNPIGNGEMPFIGTYDGGGYSIRNLRIFDSGLSTMGLFGFIGFNVEIKNVKLVDVDITGDANVGALAGYVYYYEPDEPLFEANPPQITNCSATGTVRGKANVGGLIGQNKGIVTDSNFVGTVSQAGVTHSGYLPENVGGLVGYNDLYGSISGCYAEGTVQSEADHTGGLVGLNEGPICDSHAVCNVTGNSRTGGFVGVNYQAILNCNAIGDVTGASCVGGLIGLDAGQSYISDSYFTGTVTASIDCAGGLIGLNYDSPVTNCYTNNVTVTCAGEYAGGLIGSSYERIVSCYSTGSVTGKSRVGGLVGEIHAESDPAGIYASYSTCAVEGENYVGGLAGYSEAAVSQSFATGNVTGTENETGYTYAGGLVGYNAALISNSYAWGAVSGQDMVGGLAGYNKANVTNCYEIGAVTGDDEGQYVGPLIGCHDAAFGSITASFWNNNTSGHTGEHHYGIDAGSVAMSQKATYLSEGWDFSRIWNIEPSGFNNGYPFLRWQRDSEFAGGSGTEEDPYLIATEQHLDNVRNYLDKHFLQIADLDLSGHGTPPGWEPIGTMANPFTGSYDGGGYTISNLFIERPGSWNNRVPAGLFGNIGEEAEIRNLNLDDAEVTGCYYVGGLVGYNSGNITNVSVNGEVTGEWDTGGLAGYNRGLITYSSFSGDVTGNDVIEYGDWTGGLVGYNRGTITRCWTDAVVFSEGRYVGGLAGENLADGTIAESFAMCSVTAYAFTGGLVGTNDGQITRCYSLCGVNGHDDVGGLVGGNSGQITQCYSASETVGSSGVGGLAGGTMDDNVFGSYWDMEASGQTISAGGNGRTTAQMKQMATYEGWDFITVWDIDTAFILGYPFLRWVEDAPPVLSDIRADSVTANTATLSFTSNKSGTYYYLVYDAMEGAPDKAAIKAQEERAEAKGSGIATAGVNTIEVTGLRSITAYKAYILVEYSDRNTSDIAVISFLTENSSAATVPTAPQSFTATPGDAQVALNWTAPESDGGAAISHYEVSSDNGATWVTASTNTSHTFTGLTNGTEYTFKVRAVNSVGSGAEASATATPEAPAPATHTVNFYSDGSLYASKTVTDGSALGANWPSDPTRSGHSFGGWFTGQNGAGTQYTSATIIAADVDLYAKWTYIPSSGGDGGSSSGGSSGGGDGSGDGGSSTPPTPTYQANVTTESGTETTIPVTVDEDAGTASVDASSQDLDQGVTVITIPSIPDVDTYSVGIPVPDLSTPDFQETLAVNTDAGNITVPSDMLTGIEGVDGEMAQISIGEGDKSALPDDIKDAIGDRPLIRLTLSIDGKRTGWSNPNAPVTVSIPYTPTDEELANPESIVVWYIDGSGNIVTIPNGHYDPETGMVTFSTTHFSNYAVAYNKVSFKDVTEDAWYHKAVSFIAARKITNGTGNGNYSPNAMLTRGDFIVLMMRAYGIEPDTNPTDNFSDAGNTYYTGYLAAAKRLGIAAGVGNNKYAPGIQITRQQMFTLLYNALKVIDQLPQGGSGKTLLDFSDASEIAPWAEEAMSYFVETGTVVDSGGKLAPTSTVTRAEIAQVLYNLLAK